MERKIFVLGSLNMDLVIHTPYIPRKGETLTGSDFMTNSGGKGANQAFAAAKLGGAVCMIGCVGDDAFGAQLKTNLESAGVVTTHIRHVPNQSSGVAVILIENGDNRIILDSGANACLQKEDVDRGLENAKSGDIFLAQLENPVDIIGYGLQKAKEKGMTVLLNPAPANRSILPFLQYVDILLPNESELELLGGLEILLSHGIPTVVTTLGENGYEIATDKEKRNYACIKVQAVDTTAAGDTLCGSLAMMLAKGEELEKAMAFASKCASLACTKKGAQQSVPSFEEAIQYRE